MPTTQPYLFQSARLGFREWRDEDLPAFAAMNADPEVMEFFPSTITLQQSLGFVERMKKLYAEKGYCYFAVDHLGTGDFIGFIGLCDQTYEAPFTPCVDIGWRISKAYWNQGLATEGAKCCLEYAFSELGLKNIKSVAPCINERSIKVMEKIGMHRQIEFRHPKLIGDKRLEDCVCYEINATDTRQPAA